MSANSSSNSSSNSSHQLLNDCPILEINVIMLSLLVAYVIMSPLFVSVLVLGYQRWRKRRFTASSHIDVFTYIVVFVDLLGVLGTSCYFFGSITNQHNVMNAGINMFVFFLPGQMLFHLVTCVERYLAVVHPVVYLRLRGSAGVRIRNITIGCIWLISFGVLMLVMQFKVNFSVITNLLLVVASITFGFCSFSVLCALIRPGPGEGGGDRERDQSKQRAFNTMLIITGVLSLRLLSSLIVAVIQNVSELSSVSCLIEWSSVWFFIPSSLVLPLLFLHRKGKLPGCGPKPDESA